MNLKLTMFEKIVSSSPVRSLLRNLTEGESPPLARMLLSEEGDGKLGVRERAELRLLLSALHLFQRELHTDRFVSSVLSSQLYRRMLFLGVKTLGSYGLNRPQTLAAPIMIVWNFTNACNLRCKHCYQWRGRSLYPNELSLDEKLNVVDQVADMVVPILGISGGEPLVSPHLIPVIRHAKERGLWVTVATNGTLLSEEMVGKLKEAGVDYLEVSLDSADSHKHDAFRGVEGSWRRTVDGIKRAVKAGMDVGIASTITRLNLDELDDLYHLALLLDVRKFFAFNFIPTGRGRESASIDLSPQEREEMLRRIYGYINEKRIAVCATAPQLARVCYASPDIPVAMHYAMKTRSRSAKHVAEYLGGCGAGRAYCCIQPDGKVTPCVFMEDLVVGDLREQSLKEIWEEADVFRVLRDRENLKGHCKVCEFRDICGGCRARAYAYFGDPTAPDPGCINNREAWNEIIGETVDKVQIGEGGERGWLSVDS